MTTITVNGLPSWHQPELAEELKELLSDLDHWRTALDHALPCQKNVEKSVDNLLDFYRNHVADDYYGGE